MYCVPKNSYEILLFSLVKLCEPLHICRDIQKATQNFTTVIGQGSFGPVYKAVMATGEIVAVKVLASDSKQGEKEFQTEVRAEVIFG